MKYLSKKDNCSIYYNKKLIVLTSVIRINRELLQKNYRFMAASVEHGLRAFALHLEHGGRRKAYISAVSILGIHQSALIAAIERSFDKVYHSCERP
jgi:hypothetical protein